MTSHNERHRLLHYRQGELPPTLYDTISFQCVGHSFCVARIASVMSEVLQHDIEEWPDDPYWQQKLPHWLLETFSKYSQQELTKIRSTPARWTDLDWTLGSWLDSMRDRDWRWWSLEQTASGYTLNVTIEGHPYFRSVLEHLIVAAGGILQDETNEESTGD